MANETKFRFDLFDTEISHVLQDCKYLNLPFDIDGVYEEINYILTKCGKMFFREDTTTMDLQQCSADYSVVLDISWEKLNTGHWKDVDTNWRYAYTLASLFKVLCLLARKDSNKIDIIKACDMGLLMGAPLMKNILSKIASKISAMVLSEKCQDTEMRNKKRHKSCSESEDMNISCRMKEEKHLSHEDFIVNYLEKAYPVVLVGAIKNWPALSCKPWSIDYILNLAGLRTVPIEIGSKYTDESWTQKLLTVQDFVEKYILHKTEQKEIGYLAQHNLFDQIPELLNDIEVPSYITDKEKVDISIYFGPGGTISPLHYDPKYNLLAQVMGEKYIRLYSEEETEYLYPRLNTWLSNTSQVDVEQPDLDTFPLFSKASYQECILKPGDLLFIPPKCWHYVRSLSTSISISFWW